MGLFGGGPIRDLVSGRSRRSGGGGGGSGGSVPGSRGVCRCPWIAAPSLLALGPHPPALLRSSVSPAGAPGSAACRPVARARRARVCARRRPRHLLVACLRLGCSAARGHRSHCPPVFGAQGATLVGAGSHCPQRRTGTSDPQGLQHTQRGAERAPSNPPQGWSNSPSSTYSVEPCPIASSTARCGMRTKAGSQCI